MKQIHILVKIICKQFKILHQTPNNNDFKRVFHTGWEVKKTQVCFYVQIISEGVNIERYFMTFPEYVQIAT